MTEETLFPDLEERLNQNGYLGKVVAVLTKPNGSQRIKCYGEKVDVGTLQTALNREMGTWLDYFPAEKFDPKTKVRIVEGDIFGFEGHSYVALAQGIPFNPDNPFY